MLEISPLCSRIHGLDIIFVDKQKKIQIQSNLIEINHVLVQNIMECFDGSRFTINENQLSIFGLHCIFIFEHGSENLANEHQLFLVESENPTITIFIIDDESKIKRLIDITKWACESTHFFEHIEALVSDKGQFYLA